MKVSKTATKKVVAKKPAKKEPAKKVVQEKFTQQNFNFWKLSNDLENFAFKLDSVKNIIELVAESVIDNPQSGAMWAASEMLEVYIDKLERMSMDVMDFHRGIPRPKAILDSF